MVEVGGRGKVVEGGGGFPKTPAYTIERFRDRAASFNKGYEAQEDEGSRCQDALSALHALAVRELNVDRHGSGGGAQWLLLTDKRSKLREIFALETQTVSLHSSFVLHSYLPLSCTHTHTNTHTCTNTHKHVLTQARAHMCTCTPKYVRI